MLPFSFSSRLTSKHLSGRPHTPLWTPFCILLTLVVSNVFFMICYWRSRSDIAVLTNALLAPLTTRLPPILRDPVTNEDRQIKVYIYDLPSRFNVDILRANQENLDNIPEKFEMGKEEWDCTKSIFALEIKFPTLLKQSPFYTSNAEEADFFFVPVYSVCHLNLDLPIQLERSLKFHQELLDTLRRRWPYWNRSMGRDHLFLSSMGLGRKLFPLTSGIQNSIFLSTNSDLSSSSFNFWSDVAIPPFVDPLPASTVPLEDRPYHVSFVGAVKRHQPSYSNGVRQYLFDTFAAHPGWKFVERNSNMSPDLRVQFVEILQNSVFCLAPEGNYPFTPRLVESIFLGCIPVLLSDSLIHPFADSVQYSTFTVQLSPAVVPVLPVILDGLKDDEIAYKFENLKQVRSRFVYNVPPVQGDAFYQIMDELSQRRNFSRSTPRNSIQELPVRAVDRTVAGPSADAHHIHGRSSDLVSEADEDIL
eukprot:GILJ01014203.1.p1 GENE.GILJ01014203.1~~GILJ01014203.1.p1  ORF type:complete len:475 (-),score=38.35 GILJ01014203.1:275-1699(-)